MTLPSQLVLWVMLAEPTGEMHGLGLCAVAELPSGMVHPIQADTRHLSGEPALRAAFFSLCATGQYAEGRRLTAQWTRGRIVCGVLSRSPQAIGP